MSNLIFSIEMLLTNLFKNVGHSFAGNYRTGNVEIKKSINELYNNEIPTLRNDRINLKKDGSNVASDYKKAFELKKQAY
ncbi:MAG: hypothetical protein EAZ51_02945 [Sphingobacteriales bacterium]|nr:MAG: hypothetical protein EAZ64_07525 [Sphingobacteriales bacterium]TAF82208.1 MAG: hypothetical protein EAZ51_02945 [Sphingobacteriales bacterium]